MRTVQTLKEMISQRGYTIISESKNIPNEHDRIITEKDGEKICIFTKADENFNVSKAKEYIATISSLEIKHCIIVNNNVTPIAKKLVSVSGEIEIELFSETELQYNVTHHELVPKHILITDEKEIEEIKQKYDLKNLPVILKNHIISRFL